MSELDADRAVGAAFGFCVLAIVAADALGFTARPAAEAMAGWVADAVTAMAAPALFLLCGYLAARGRAIAGCPPGRAAPLLLAAYALVVVGRFSAALAGAGIDDSSAGAIFAEVPGEAALLPGLALMLWLAPALKRVTALPLIAGAFLLALAAHRFGYGVIAIAGSGLLFFAVGLRLPRLVAGFLGAAVSERGVLLGALGLIAIGGLAARSGIAGAPFLAQLLGLCGTAAALALAASAGRRVGPAVDWVGRQWLLLALAVGVPLGVSDTLPLAAILPLPPLLAFAALADAETGDTAARRLRRLLAPIPQFARRLCLAGSPTRRSA